MSESHEEIIDGCAGWGAKENWAVVWFLAVLVIGSALTIVLSEIDRRFYYSSGEYLDMQKYYDNRKTQTSIPLDINDSRSSGTLSAATSQFNNR